VQPADAAFARAGTAVVQPRGSNGWSLDAIQSLNLKIDFELRGDNAPDGKRPGSATHSARVIGARESEV
jgi:hypothetical protein